MAKTAQERIEYQKAYNIRTGYAAQAKYNREHITRFTITLNEKDAAVIEKLKSVENRTDYVRKLILADIEK